MRSMKRLEGKIALVTGGSRGIGRATALRLAFEGAHTLVHYGKNASAAESALREIAENGGSGATIQAEFGQAGAIARLFEAVDRHLREMKADRLDVLVNNAGIGLIEGLEEVSEETFDNLFEVNVKSPFFVTQQAVMRMHDGGRIINVGSIVTRMAMPAVGAYAMSKGSLETMTLWLAKQLGPRGITVNSVAPGIIDTEMNAAALSDPASRSNMESLSALGRVGTPEDVANVVAFLASTDGRWVSGQRIEASGGTFLG